MIFSSMLHEAKSAQSYAFDADTLHIRFKTARNDISNIEVLAVDPFNWIPRNDGTPIYDFDVTSVIRISMTKEQVTEDYDCWFAQIPNIKWKRMKYCFVAENQQEKFIVGSRDRIPYTTDADKLYNLSNYFNYPYIHEEDIYQAPDWVSDTIWYQIFPERFCNGTPDDGRSVLAWGSEEVDGYDKKFGGNLAGIIQKLDYIKDAGFNGIYLNPIFDSPSSHKYDTTDYYKIDPNLGDNSILGQLVEEAHKRGIKVMLDAVFNHCGYYHPFWQDVLKHGAQSEYYDCFYILDPDKPIVSGEIKNGLPGECSKEELNFRTFAYTQVMPKWNTGNPIARKYLLDVAAYWIENYHIDGWRLDVSNEVSHDFWREFRKTVKSMNRDIYILGETWDNSYPWLMGDQFDAVMNYEFSVPVWNFFRDRQGTGVTYNGEEFQHRIGKLLTEYPKHLTENLFNLLDSHDTERILNIVGGNAKKVELAYLFLFTFPGTPCIYYGSEIGMGGGEHSNRQCMIWDKDRQNKELYEFIQKLIDLRKKTESFRSVELFFLDLPAHNDTILYRKSASKERVYVLIHNNPEQEVLTLPKELKGLLCYDLFHDKDIRLEDTLVLKPYDYRIFQVKHNCE
ncbi:glycoside hydrolase family 13 protein [Konateibacter massiliensis]|uniref:glycoside hydrolase family 13 protein n=1 Tax=Konateibacter massiliensis TaxID=2002841 RepID=UPI000C149F6F|nr:glycoside hydrolase family 13 protein [Konateibacter massiliensis]